MSSVLFLSEFLLQRRSFHTTSSMDSASRLAVLAGLLACLLLLCLAQERDYTVKEEQPENVRIGNLRKDLDLNLDPNIRLSSPLQFKPVYKTGDVPLVRVEANTGEIFTTNHRIDREKLCSGVFAEKRCYYEIEVAVLPDEIFRLVKIRFLIEDVNDNAPLFQSTVINISIPENTAINTRYPVPSAFDPDVGINGIQHYELVKVRLFAVSSPTQHNNRVYDICKTFERHNSHNYPRFIYCWIHLIEKSIWVDLTHIFNMYFTGFPFRNVPEYKG